MGTSRRFVYVIIMPLWNPLNIIKPMSELDIYILYTKNVNKGITWCSTNLYRLIYTIFDSTFSSDDYIIVILLYFFLFFSFFVYKNILTIFVCVIKGAWNIYFYLSPSLILSLCDGVIHVALLNWYFQT
jgi:hypothetical protein